MYYVYILTNKRFTVFYTGMTNDLQRRMNEHKKKLLPGFTSKYEINKLLYYEELDTVSDAFHREKQIKKYKQEYKHNLINSMNPEWEDLSEGW